MSWGFRQRKPAVWHCRPTILASVSLSLCLSHRYIADRWACCLCQAVVHHSCWIIHVLQRRGAEWDRPYKAKLIKVAVLKLCLCLFQEERKERSVVIPFLSPCLHHSSPHLLPTLASLIPLFPRLSQENYNLTAHFNISASKLVWQALLCAYPHPLLPPASSLCPYLHPSTHPYLAVPTSLCRLLIAPPTAQLLPCDRREREWGRRGKKQKQIRLKPRPLCQAIRLSLSEFHDTYTTMNLQWGEVSLHPDVCHSQSGLNAHRQCFRLTERVVISSTETDMDSE